MMPKPRNSQSSHDQASSVRIVPILPLLGRYGGALHAIEMRLREISPFLPDAIAQSADDRLDAALKVLAEMLKE